MSNTHITGLRPKSILTPQRPQHATRDAMARRVMHLANPNAMLDDMKEEVSFMESERADERDVEEENVRDRADALLAEFVKKLLEQRLPHDKAQESMDRKVARHIANLTRREESGAGGGGEDALAMLRELSSLGEDKAALLVSLERVKISSAQKGDKKTESRCAALQEDLARHFEPQIRASLNVRHEVQQFAAQAQLEADSVLSAYQSTVADYSGILPALLVLCDKLGYDNTEQGAAFIRHAASRDIATLRPSVAPEQLMHILAELKGLQVFNTVKSKVATHRETMERSEGGGGRPQEEGESGQAGGEGGGVQALPPEKLVVGLLQSAVHPQNFYDRLGHVSEIAYENDRQNLILHFQGLHKIMKDLPSYAFVDKLDQKRALQPLENSLDRLIGQEKENL